MKLSVVIPTLNEAANIPELLKALQANSDARLHEIIVVDGHSTDQTCALAQQAGASVATAPQRGRAIQLHTGATHATGDVLYFLHADSRPPANFIQSIENALQKGSNAGAFRLCFDSAHPLMRCYGFLSRLRWRIARGGDASLFVTAELYHRLDGFNTRLPVMEDIDIVQRLRKHTHFTILPHCVKTSARRYAQKGVLRLQLLFGLMHLGWWLGISPQRLGGFYRKFIEL